MLALNGLWQVTCPGSPDLSTEKWPSPGPGAKWLPPSGHHSAIQRQRQEPLAPPLPHLPQEIPIFSTQRLVNSQPFGGQLGPVWLKGFR